MSETVFTYAAPALKFGPGASAEVGHDLAFRSVHEAQKLPGLGRFAASDTGPSGHPSR